MSEKSKTCDKCKRYLREDGGCTHCERSELVDGALKEVSVDEAEKIVLSEPVDIKRDGHIVRFSADKLVKGHLADDHTKADYKRRMVMILYAFDAVRNGKYKHMTKISDKTGEAIDRHVYRKDYAVKHGGKDVKMKCLVVADTNGEVREVFTFYANR